MWKKVAIGVIAVVAIFVVVVATRPSEFRIQRSLQMNAPREVVFGLINDFHAWRDWSPWEKLDPGMKKEFSGSEAGTGAVYSWEGNDQVGSGRMTIVKSEPAEKVDIQLEFLKPWEATNQTHFTVAPAGSQAEVTWEMVGQNDFAGKAMGLFMDMDALVGADFEKGLASMKQLAEAKAEALAKEKAALAEAEAKAAAEAKAKADAEAAAAADAELPPP
jgi:hypothetical protein